MSDTLTPQPPQESSLIILDIRDAPGQVLEEVAILLAATVLHTYEQTNPEDLRLQTALVAAINLVLDPTDENYGSRDGLLESAMEAAKDAARADRGGYSVHVAYAIFGAVQLEFTEVMERILNLRHDELTKGSDLKVSERRWFLQEDEVRNAALVFAQLSAEDRRIALEEVREDLQEQIGSAS